jgi:uncharacterized membrane protein YgdD (TMEM256/DUF423 family)
MNKTIFGTGIFFGVFAIILGAFGAHGLEQLIDAKALQSFGTGVRYQMYHALFLLILGNLKELTAKEKMLVYYLVSMGIVFFSFSIYLLATNSLTGFDFKTLGLITPFGGVLLILGWLVLAYRIFRQLN